MEDLQEKILRLEEEISKLPVGYISRKNIKGTIRQYHQWTENGEKKSKYMDDATAAVMAEQIAKRKELQQELKTAKALLPKKRKNSNVENIPFITNVLLGGKLHSFIQRATSLKNRPSL